MGNGASYSGKKFGKPNSGICWHHNGYYERKKAEEEIANIHKENETVLNRINDAVVSIDNEWRYTFLNDAALPTHPLGREGTIGKVIWDVHPEMKGTVILG